MQYCNDNHSWYHYCTILACWPGAGVRSCTSILMPCKLKHSVFCDICMWILLASVFILLFSYVKFQMARKTNHLTSRNCFVMHSDLWLLASCITNKWQKNCSVLCTSRCLQFYCCLYVPYNLQLLLQIFAKFRLFFVHQNVSF